MQYSKDGPFTDPVVRCDDCHRMLFVSDLRINGSCNCGNRRVKNVLSVGFWELVKLKSRKIDKEFVKLFDTNKFQEKVSDLLGVLWLG